MGCSGSRVVDNNKVHNNTSNAERFAQLLADKNFDKVSSALEYASFWPMPTKKEYADAVLSSDRALWVMAGEISSQDEQDEEVRKQQEAILSRIEERLFDYFADRIQLHAKLLVCALKWVSHRPALRDNYGAMLRSKSTASVGACARLCCCCCWCCL